MSNSADSETASHIPHSNHSIGNIGRSVYVTVGFFGGVGTRMRFRLIDWPATTDDRSRIDPAQNYVK